MDLHTNVPRQVSEWLLPVFVEHDRSSHAERMVPCASSMFVLRVHARRHFSCFDRKVPDVEANSPSWYWALTISVGNPPSTVFLHNPCQTFPMIPSRRVIAFEAQRKNTANITCFARSQTLHVRSLRPGNALIERRVDLRSTD